MNAAERWNKYDEPLPATARGLDNYLLKLLCLLRASDYHFMTPTPLTHQRFIRQSVIYGRRSLRDIFGWNLGFQWSGELQPFLAVMARADVLLGNGTLRSAVRVASLDDDLFLHSSYPTNDDSAIFFGPDTYRFVRFLQQWGAVFSLPDVTCLKQKPKRVLDVGCGSGAGGIAAVRMLAAKGQETLLTLSDINPRALQFASVNAEFARLPATTVLSDGFEHLGGEFDLIITNPPYMEDEQERLYRHGGAQLGRTLSVRLATEALAHLAPGGSLVLYTGVAIVDGIDGFLADLQQPLQQSGCTWSYTEVDPDEFGEELERPAYRRAERIAAVGLIVTRPQQSRS